MMLFTFLQLGWALRIQRVTPDDAGIYECQATTHPPQSIVTRLKVVGKYLLQVFYATIMVR
jgi:hypothetical protein